jgi:hypothetical protein
MKRSLALGLAVLTVFSFSAGADANHSWGGYHWSRPSNPITLKVIDSVTSAWDASLDGAIADWAASSAIDLTEVDGSTTSRDRKKCPAQTGKIRVCNAAYGLNGWLGIAEIWLTGDGHIAQGRTKLNDSYYSKAAYNTPAWRNFVTCQELGHDFGLDHQDETFDNANLGTCMDYTNSPSSNQHPNAHDYSHLETIYSHTDGTSTASATTAAHDYHADDDHRVSKDGRYTKLTFIYRAHH